MNCRSFLLAGTITVVSAAALSAGPVPSDVEEQATPPGPPAPGPPAPGPPAARGGPDAAISAGQVQRWFEAFTVLQAQEALQLSEAQYGRFVTRLKALQDPRRKHHMARNQIMGDLKRRTNPQNGSNDDGALTERLKALRDDDERASVAVQKGYDSVDETLDIRQQALRIFEADGAAEARAADEDPPECSSRRSGTREELAVRGRS